MKRMIRASVEYPEYATFQHGRKRFSSHINYDGPYEGSFAATISEIHPYDDAEYTWAKIAFNGSVKFIRDGKVVDKMQLPTYEEDDYGRIEDYYDDMLDTVAVELIDMNRDVKPIMVHN